MYLVELRPCAKLVMPSSSLMPSRKQVLPEPLGPVATLIPSISSGIGSGRSDPQWTNWTSSIRGIVPLPLCFLDAGLEPPGHFVDRWAGLESPGALVHRGAGLEAPRPPVQLRGPDPQVGEPLVAADQGPGLVGGARLVQGVQQGPGLNPPLAQGQVAGPGQPFQHAGQAGAVQPRPQQLGQVAAGAPGLVRPPLGPGGVR